jgi:D-glycero-D-manno-heptose 1,7-bisphosphate phosphatase
MGETGSVPDRTIISIPAHPRRAVLLDRDGVLNVDRYVTYRPEQLALIEGAVEGLSWLQALGFLLIVVSNQPAIGRGHCSVGEVERFNRALCDRLAAHGVVITDVFICPHDAVGGVGAYRTECACRKPRPGMLFAAADRHGLDLAASYMIGDKMSDVAAGFNAGCRTILVETGILDDGARYSHVAPDACLPDLPAAARYIAGQRALEEMHAQGQFVPPFDAALCADLLARP